MSTPSTPSPQLNQGGVVPQNDAVYSSPPNLDTLARLDPQFQRATNALKAMFSPASPMMLLTPGRRAAASRPQTAFKSPREAAAAATKVSGQTATSALALTVAQLQKELKETKQQLEKECKMRASTEKQLQQSKQQLTDMMENKTTTLLTTQKLQQAQKEMQLELEQYHKQLEQEKEAHVQREAHLQETVASLRLELDTVNAKWTSAAEKYLETAKEQEKEHEMQLPVLQTEIQSQKERDQKAVRLEKENARLTEENALLKKALQEAESNASSNTSNNNTDDAVGDAATKQRPQEHSLLGSAPEEPPSNDASVARNDSNYSTGVSIDDSPLSNVAGDHDAQGFIPSDVPVIGDEGNDAGSEEEIQGAQGDDLGSEVEEESDNVDHDGDDGDNNDDGDDDDAFPSPSEEEDRVASPHFRATHINVRARQSAQETASDNPIAEGDRAMEAGLTNRRPRRTTRNLPTQRPAGTRSRTAAAANPIPPEPDTVHEEEQPPPPAKRRRGERNAITSLTHRKTKCLHCDGVFFLPLKDGDGREIDYPMIPGTDQVNQTIRWLPHTIVQFLRKTKLVYWRRKHYEEKHPMHESEYPPFIQRDSLLFRSCEEEEEDREEEDEIAEEEDIEEEE